MKTAPTHNKINIPPKSVLPSRELNDTFAAMLTDIAKIFNTPVPYFTTTEDAKILATQGEQTVRSIRDDLARGVNTDVDQGDHTDNWRLS